MAVEIYFNQELSDITFEVEALDEWKSIAEELGMENQLQLTKGVSSPVQYPFMNEVMERVYNTLCPTKVLFKDYKHTTIPLEVMKQIAFSVKEGNFQKIEIWFDNKAPDPLVVGYTCKYYGYATDPVSGKSDTLKDEGGALKKFTSKEEHAEYCDSVGLIKGQCHDCDSLKYLIARWGDELRAFSELKILATERLIEDLGGELKKEIATKTEKLKLIKENASSFFNGNMSMYELKGSSW